MALATYRRKRNFARTPEPQGRARGKRSAWLYVVQKHAASHLHYDFRLQLGDVLLSWAVPKGPSLDPAVKRLAMQVEDHPVEYGSFEGIIPAGQYGGGTVMLWDRGTWQPEGDAAAGYRAGKLHFTLHGEKLRGGWVLVRRGTPTGGGKQAWLLFKLRDDEARPRGPDVLTAEPLSVASGRDMQAIAADSPAVWNSNGKQKRAAGAPHKSGPPRRARRSSRTGRLQPGKLPGARTAALPKSVAPELATLVKSPPEGDQWFSEIKFDGYRMIARVDGSQVQLFSRNQLDWTARLPHLETALGKLPVKQAIFDGEVVALDSHGASSFQAMQNAFREGRSSQLVYYVFDLLYLNGTNLTDCALEDRKELLALLLAGSDGPLRYSEHLVGHAAELFDEAAQRHLEGIVCKRRDRPYRGGRGADWLKVKCAHREEFVIGGYTPPAGSRQAFGALLLGYHDPNGELIYAGRVGTGFSEAMLGALGKRLKKIEQPASPFANLHGTKGQARGVRWVQPRLVVQVEFSQWTRDGNLRHPAFLGLREDKPAAEVTRELAESVAAVERKRPAGARSKSRRAAPDPPTSAAAPQLTHPDKQMFPDSAVTKADLASYYALVAEWMLPQIADRPLVLVRCPQGGGHDCFYQKHARAGTPAELRRIPIVEKGQQFQYVAADDLAALQALVQIGTLEIHAWGSRADAIERPDRLVFDLDPGPKVAWPRLIESAQQIREFFADLDLVTFVKTTGGKGLHVILPIDRRIDWDEAKQFCHTVAKAIEAADPKRYVATMSKAARDGRIYIDYLRNARGATSVAAYSPRARAGAPVATPVSWKELPKITSSAEFGVTNLAERLKKLKADPWNELASTRQSISKSLLKKLGV